MAPLAHRRAVAAAVPIAAIVVLLLVGYLAAGTLHPDPVRPAPSVGPAVATFEVVRPAGGANTVVGTITNISAPFQGTYDPIDGDLYFPDSTAGFLAGDNSSNVTIISGTTNQVVGQIYQGEYANLETPTFDPANDELYIPNDNSTPTPYFANNVTAISGLDDLVANIDTGNDSYPLTPVYDPVNHLLYVSDEATSSFEVNNDNVSVIDPATNTVEKQILVGLGPTEGAYDPADGDIYVPDSTADATDQTNVSIINGTSNTVIATITGLSTPTMPVYDPVNQEMYVVNVGTNNMSVLKGTSLIENISIEPASDGGVQFASPVVDPVNGEIYVPAEGYDSVTVVSPENVVIANLSGGSDFVGNEQPIYDPVNGFVYVPGTASDGSGVLYAINTASNTVTLEIPVAEDPVTPTFDPATDMIYVPGFDANNITIVNGSAPTAPPPGTYAATFAETGLTSGYWWNIDLNGTVENRSTTTIVFSDLPNGVYPYTIGAWDNPDACVLDESSESGSVTIDDAAATVDIAFTCASTGSPSSPQSPGSGFLGLPGDEGYALLGGIVVVVVLAVVLLAVRSRRPRPPSGGGPGNPAPPGAGGAPPSWGPPPPPPPPPT